MRFGVILLLAVQHVEVTARPVAMIRLRGHGIAERDLLGAHVLTCGFVGLVWCVCRCLSLICIGNLAGWFGIRCQSVHRPDLRFEAVFGVVWGHLVGSVFGGIVVFGEFRDGFGDFGEDVAAFKERIFHLNLFVFYLAGLYLSVGSRIIYNLKFTHLSMSQKSIKAKYAKEYINKSNQK